MHLTEDSFRALARSSPWRWQALHFRRHGAEGVEAWVNRPGELRVVDASGRTTHERIGLEEASSGVLSVVADADGAPAPRQPRIVRRWPHEAEPTRRPDGLVEHRPESHEWDGVDVQVIEYGDPMYVNYHWVAMLDPRELSDHTSVTDLRADVHHGRPVWRARVAPVEGYDPTCGCCALLWSEISDRDEYDDDWPLDPNRVHPEAYDVALDVETGIVVALDPVGETSNPDHLDVEILESTRWPTDAG